MPRRTLGRLRKTTSPTEVGLVSSDPRQVAVRQIDAPVSDLGPTVARPALAGQGSEAARSLSTGSTPVNPGSPRTFRTARRIVSPAFQIFGEAKPARMPAAAHRRP